MEDKKSLNQLPKDFDIYTNLNITKPTPSLEAYLNPWKAFRLVPKNESSLKKMIGAAFIELSNSNIKFIELRSTVIHIARNCSTSIEVVLEWMIYYIKHYCDLCNIKAGLILTVSRSDKSLEDFKNLLNAYKNLRFPSMIVGLDLAGDEKIPYPNGLDNLYRKAKDDYNLKITIHAGETGNIQNIEDAINNFSADRIGHGTAASESPKLMEIIKKRDICVEVCPISNSLSGALVDKPYHPVVDFVKNEVPFVICSDNPAVHKANLNDDYLEFYNIYPDMSLLNNMFSSQNKYSFLKS